MAFPTIHGDRTLELGNPGPMRDFLNELVLSGKKRATAALWEIYLEEGEEIESEGERLWLLNNELSPIAQVEVLRCDIRKFNQIDLDFVAAEGEGHADLGAWRQQQRAYWSATAEPEMQAAGYEGWRVNKETLVVCLWFQLVDGHPDLLTSN